MSEFLVRFTEVLYAPAMRQPKIIQLVIESDRREDAILKSIDHMTRQGERVKVTIEENPPLMSAFNIILAKGDSAQYLIDCGLKSTKEDYSLGRYTITSVQPYTSFADKGKVLRAIS